MSNPRTLMPTADEQPAAPRGSTDLLDRTGSRARVEGTGQNVLMDAPSGDVTLLFTDIEGSTRLWEAHPDAMAEALRRHDAVLRRVIGAHRGYVFKTVGDAFCAAFATATAAVSAAVEIQQALSAERWPPETAIQVRMGLHSGACEERDGDYFGPVVNRTARLEATAHGGQIVLSANTAALLAAGPTLGVTLVDLGEHRLKDLTVPERVAQVVSPGLMAEFPPLRSLSNPALGHNLPQVASSFVGRHADLLRLRELLATSRLVTLTGPGGTGKTRLALQAGAEALDGSADGVWFCDLSPLTHPEAVAREVASVLGVPEVPDHDPLDILADSLVSRSLLLVLDNCEHLLVPTGALVGRLLAGCLGIVVLATSREPLSVPGEHVLRVAPLGLPRKDDGADPLTEVLGSEAATLFVARARAHDDRFVLDEVAAPLVATICRRLDGLPLALELAAARLRAMSLADLEGGLGDHLRLLRRPGGQADGGRQQTITALIDWSHRLLSEAEQAVFARLSVFAGPFLLPGAMAVGAGDDLDDLEVEDAVFSLVDKSLLVPEANGPTTRYRYLESIRQFAGARLEAAGAQEVNGARGRLVAFYDGLAASAESQLFGPDEEAWRQRLDDEQPNLLVAFEHAAAGHGVGDRGLAMGGALYLYWLVAEPTLGIEVLQRALSKNDEEVAISVRAKATWVLAEMCEHVGRYEQAQALAEEAFAIALPARELAVASQARKVAALCALTRAERDGVGPSIGLMQEARQLAERSGDPLATSFVIHDSGNVLLEAGDVEVARERYIEALGWFERLGSSIGIALATMNLGNVAETAGDIDDAYEWFTRSFELLRRQRRHQVGPLAGLTALNLALVLATRGDSEEALRYLGLGVPNARALPHWVTLLTAALVAHASGDPETAAVLHGAADTHLEMAGGSAGEHSIRLHRDDIEALRSNGSLDVDRLFELGRRMTEDEALRFVTDFAARHGRPHPAHTERAIGIKRSSSSQDR